jgi:hypothetical protein
MNEQTIWNKELFSNKQPEKNIDDDNFQTMNMIYKIKKIKKSKKPKVENYKQIETFDTILTFDERSFMKGSLLTNSFFLFNSNISPEKVPRRSVLRGGASMKFNPSKP